MKNILIYHHLGLGDHVVCNGLVRELVYRHHPDFAYVPVKHHNFDSVRRMYADSVRIVCVPVRDDHDAESLVSILGCSKVFKAGFEKCRRDWDVSFYDSVGIPFEKRWTEFKCDRDYSRERKLELIVNPSEGPFILIHNTGSERSYPVVTRNDLPIIHIEPIVSGEFNGCLVDWCRLIEKAEEIHCVDSSAIHFCASLGRPGVFHDFGKCDSWGGHFRLPSNWTTINCR
jgi:hypothetical protein